MARLAVLALLGLGLAVSLRTEAADGPPLRLETKIPLGKVSGRIDHLAIDLSRRRLFVAELGNNSVGVVDLGEHKLIATIAGLAEPQGVGYEASTDTLYIANAADGSVHMFQGVELAPSGKIKLGDDADNIRVEFGRPQSLHRLRKRRAGYYRPGEPREDRGHPAARASRRLSARRL